MLIIYSIPNLNVPENIQDEIRRIHREFVKDHDPSHGDFIHKESGPYSAYYFEVPSDLNPLAKIPVVLTLYFVEHENIKIFEPIIVQTINQLQAIPDLSKAFYISVSHTTAETYTTFGKVIKVLTDCFFQASKKHATYNLGLAEVLVLGTKGSGKTSVIDYLVNGKFLEPATPTLSPQVLQLVFESIDFRVLDVCCKEHIQEVLEDHPLEPGKLPQAIAFIVEASASPEKQKTAIQEFNYWMDYLKKQYTSKNFTGLPVLVLFNKLDLNPTFQQSQFENAYDATKYGATARYGTISAKTGYGIADNFRWLVSKIKYTKKA